MEQKQLDGWMNIYTGAGTNKDPKTGRTFLHYKRPDNALANFYSGEGMIRRITRLPITSMLRPNIIISEQLNLSLRTVKQKLQEALIWNRLFGGSVVVAGISNSGNLQDDIKISSASKVIYLRSYSSSNVEPVHSSIIHDTESPYFGQPELWQINSNIQSYTVHRSRIFVFSGDEYPTTSATTKNSIFGLSQVNPIIDYVERLVNAYISADSILEDFIQTILKINNLADLVEGNQEDLIKKRLEIIDMGRSMLNTIMIDGTEDYSKTSSSVAGLDKIIQEFYVSVSAVSGIPVTLLMGRSPAGQNSTGKSDFQQWYDVLNAERERVVLPFFEWIYSLEGKNIVDKIEFMPYVTPTEKEVSETHKTQAEADNIYLQAGVLLPAEVRNSRFGKSDYSTQTEIGSDLPMINLDE